MVVLDEIIRDAVVAQHAGPERLEEEAALVAVDGGREEQRTLELGWE